MSVMIPPLAHAEFRVAEAPLICFSTFLPMRLLPY